MTTPPFRKGDRVQWVYQDTPIEGVVTREPFQHNGDWMYWVKWAEGDENEYHESDLRPVFNGVDYMMRLL